MMAALNSMTRPFLRGYSGDPAIGNVDLAPVPARGNQLR